MSVIQGAVFDDVEIGQDIPNVVKGPMTSAHIMRWSAAMENWHRIHYDYPFTTGHDKNPGLLINGSWKQHMLAQTLRHWRNAAADATIERRNMARAARHWALRVLTKCLLGWDSVTYQRQQRRIDEAHRAQVDFPTPQVANYSVGIAQAADQLRGQACPVGGRAEKAPVEESPDA